VPATKPKRPKKEEAAVTAASSPVRETAVRPLDRILGRRPGRVAWPVQLAIFAHMFIILCWALPGPPKGFDEVVRRAEAPPVWRAPQAWALDWKDINVNPRTEKYLFLTGLWQNWNMFAPHPANVSVWMDAEVDFPDGSTKPFQYPRVEEMSIPVKFVNERYRKYLESAHKEAHSFLWPPLAQWIALEAHREEGQPPSRVRLYRNFREIYPPGLPQPAEERFLFFDYNVNQEMLLSAHRGGKQ
jgi:hypothetical protein